MKPMPTNFTTNASAGPSMVTTGFNSAPCGSMSIVNASPSSAISMKTIAAEVNFIGVAPWCPVVIRDGRPALAILAYAVAG